MMSFRALSAVLLMAAPTAFVGCSSGGSQHPGGTQYENQDPGDKTVVSRPLGEPDWVSITPLKIGPDAFSVVVVGFKDKLANPEKWKIDYAITTAAGGNRVNKSDALVEADITPNVAVKTSPEEVDLPKDAQFLTFIVRTKGTLAEDMCLIMSMYPKDDSTKYIKGKISIDSGDGVFPSCP